MCHLITHASLTRMHAAADCPVSAQTICVSGSCHAHFASQKAWRVCRLSGLHRSVSLLRACCEPVLGLICTGRILNLLHLPISTSISIYISISICLPLSNCCVIIHQHVLIVVTTDIFPHVALGFADTVSAMREETVKAVLFLAPKLSPKILNDDIPKAFAKLQVCI